MAVNEKVVYAESWTCHGGKVYRPGEQLSGSMPEHAIKGAQEQGLTTDSHATAERAKAAEHERRERVAEQIQTRSEPREDARGIDRSDPRF
jgi:hypothetical protein